MPFEWPTVHLLAECSALVRHRVVVLCWVACRCFRPHIGNSRTGHGTYSARHCTFCRLEHTLTSICTLIVLHHKCKRRKQSNHRTHALLVCVYLESIPSLWRS